MKTGGPNKGPLASRLIRQSRESLTKLHEVLTSEEFTSGRKLRTSLLIDDIKERLPNALDRLSPPLRRLGQSTLEKISPPLSKLKEINLRELADELGSTTAKLKDMATPELNRLLHSVRTQQQVKTIVALSLERIPPAAHQAIDFLGPVVYTTSSHRMFEKGWGEDRILDSLYRMKENPDPWLADIMESTPVNLDIKWDSPRVNAESVSVDGNFLSPLHHLLPEEAKQCHFRLILPRPVLAPNAPLEAPLSPLGVPHTTPICFFFAATGDHGYSLRKTLFTRHLLDHGIASLIIENPFYGLRKPRRQYESCLWHLSDLFMSGASLISESLVLKRHLRNIGHNGTLGFSGLSMGGIHSGLVGSFVRDEPVAVVPIIAPHSAAPVFTEGVLSRAVSWSALAEKLPSRAPPGVDSRQYFHQVLSDLTDVQKYRKLKYPQFAIQLTAKHDAYVPSGHVIHDYWKGSEMRVLNTGHLTSVVLGFPEMRIAIVDAFKRLEEAKKNEALTGIPIPTAQMISESGLVVDCDPDDEEIIDVGGEGHQSFRPEDETPQNHEQHNHHNHHNHQQQHAKNHQDHHHTR